MAHTPISSHIDAEGHSRAILSSLPHRMAGLNLHPEEEAVLLCALAERDAAQEYRLRHLLGQGEEIASSSFWAEAAEQQVSPLTARTLSSHRLAPYVPHCLVERARSVRMQTMLRNLALHSELLRVAHALQSQDIPVVPLKGTHLCEYAYGSLDARQVGDIDILVPDSRVVAAHRVLREMGYAPATTVSPGLEEHTFHGVPLVRHGSAFPFVIEVHWQITDPAFATIDYEHLWGRVLAMHNDSSPLIPLPDEERLLFLSLHLAKHEAGVLRLLADVDRLLRLRGNELDWPYFLILAQRWSAETLAYFALRRSSQLLETPVPSWILERLRPSSVTHAVVDLLAGPMTILRPPTSQHLRYNRFRLAYCLMLQPAGRAVRAYWRYIFLTTEKPRAGFLERLHSTATRIGRGAAWTTLVFANALADRRFRGPSHP